MAMNPLARIALGVVASLTSGIVAAVLHYKAHTPQLVTFCAILLPAIGASLLFWKSFFARLLASIALAGVSWFSALWVAMGVFHDGL